MPFFYSNSNGKKIPCQLSLSLPRQRLGLLGFLVIPYHLFNVLDRIRVAARVVQLPAPAWHVAGPALALVSPAYHGRLHSAFAVGAIIAPRDIDEAMYRSIVLLVEQLHPAPCRSLQQSSSSQSVSITLSTLPSEWRVALFRVSFAAPHAGARFYALL